ncbi:MAG TPA: glycosyltransferase family 2 protein [Planctomycetaceae bacterium]|nr:glycosyltransferase family 2 protein [Planctomycetaceae bacterium]HCD00066.1 glycosyltransferase family 2 protein [Planctomycetaceae bacterium]|tara:strand:+ start:862 stop:1572 length:711 start_codon:yes stop_codon:yes gene_type:complete
MRPVSLAALPVYNEAAHVDEVLDNVLRHCQDVLVVDDGSTDGTAQRLARRSDIRVETHTTNRGYGAALLTAFDYAINHEFDVVVTIDCDGQHEPELIPELVSALQAHQADILSGSRYLEIENDSSHPPEDRRQINVDVTERLNDALQLELTDAFCGFKAYRTEALRRLSLTETGYAMPLELWVQAVRAGMRIVEHPVPLIYLDEERSFGGSLDDANLRMSYYLEVLDRALAATPTR